MDGTHQALQNFLKLGDIAGRSALLRTKNCGGSAGAEQGIADIHSDLKFTLGDSRIQLPQVDPGKALYSLRVWLDVGPIFVQEPNSEGGEGPAPTVVRRATTESHGDPVRAPVQCIADKFPKSKR